MTINRGEPRRLLADHHADVLQRRTHVQTTGGRQPPLGQLEADLKEAVVLMDSNSRKAAGLAVKACLEFVYAHPHLTAQSLSRPLFDLLAALNDLDQGIRSAMLEPALFGNRPPERAVRQQAKAYACFCVDQLKGIGVDVASACKAASRVWEQCHCSFGGRAGTPPWKTIKDWRYRTSKLRGDNTQRVVLETVRREAAQGMAAGPWSKDEILDQLDRNLRSLGKSALE
jgi:hypothetical protein